ncbi:YqaA family protein [Chloroflexota bacterium]
MPSPRAKENYLTPRSWYRRWPQVLALASIIAVTVAIILLFRDIERFETYGYLGAFLANLIGSATIIMPAPGEAVVAALGAVLNPLVVGVVASIGGTLGELTGYLVGYWGREVVSAEQMKGYRQAERWMRRYGSLTVFAFALVPFLIFDLVGISAGTLRFPLWKFLLAAWLGRLIRALLVAYLGGHLFNIFFPGLS